ncbi:MAG: hypothetical protein INR62_02460 [Rhodospirillales bacterium]|nr:hypothetical protein [Acetobacter sp.]
MTLISLLTATISLATANDNPARADIDLVKAAMRRPMGNRFLAFVFPVLGLVLPSHEGASHGEPEPWRGNN